MRGVGPLRSLDDAALLGILDTGFAELVEGFVLPKISGGALFDASPGSFRGAAATNSGSVSATNGAETVQTYDTTLFDTDSFHSTVTNTSRLTVPTNLGGHYVVGQTGEFASNASGDRYMVIRKNGSSGQIQTIGMGHATGATGAFCSCVAFVTLVDTDFIEVYNFQNSGGGINSVNNGLLPMLWALRIGG